jgi:catechol 2,3-dioxygenase-like lactoylglutathione lyase family enzyme
MPVSDVDRSKRFYQELGWRLDADKAIADGLRVVQLTPPESAASVTFGTGITSAAPGSVEGLILSVDSIDTAHADLINHGIEVAGASFSDPDGNGWLLQEIKARLAGT